LTPFSPPIPLFVRLAILFLDLCVCHVGCFFTPPFTSWAPCLGSLFALSTFFSPTSFLLSILSPPPFPLSAGDCQRFLPISFVPGFAGTPPDFGLSFPLPRPKYERAWILASGSVLAWRTHPHSSLGPAVCVLPRPLDFFPFFPLFRFFAPAKFYALPLTETKSQTFCRPWREPSLTSFCKQ